MFEALASSLAAPLGPNPIGQVEWLEPGTYQWICPEDVTLVCCVVVAAGQMSTYPTSANVGKAGDGGGLRWKNNIAVVPGAAYQIVVGQNRQPNGTNPPDLSYTATFTNTGNTTTSALGLTAGSGNSGTPFGNGVGGGYGGAGNTLGQINTGGSSGGYRNGVTPRPTTNSYSGHGVNLIGGDLTNGNSAAPAYPADGGTCGGGGQSRNADNSTSVKRVRAGGKGGVRIMWGRGRAYPDNAANVIT